MPGALIITSLISPESSGELPCLGTELAPKVEQEKKKERWQPQGLFRRRQFWQKQFIFHQATLRSLYSRLLVIVASSFLPTNSSSITSRLFASGFLFCFRFLMLPVSALILFYLALNFIYYSFHLLGSLVPFILAIICEELIGASRVFRNSTNCRWKQVDTFKPVRLSRTVFQIQLLWETFWSYRENPISRKTTKNHIPHRLNHPTSDRNATLRCSDQNVAVENNFKAPPRRFHTRLKI